MSAPLHELNNPELSLKALIKKQPLVKGDEKILVLGANGQVAQFLVPELQKHYGKNLILADLKANPEKDIIAIDVTDKAALMEYINPKHKVKVVINLAAMLSADAQNNLDKAMKINIEAPKIIMELAKKNGVEKIFTPSSIAALGEDARKLGEQSMDFVEKGGIGTPMDAPVSPISAYGTAKKILEENSAAINREYKKPGDLLALCLRYGGVLTCQKKPSDGTTEEIDKMVSAAAEFKARQDLGLPTISEAYRPKVPEDSVFPLLDGRTVATETMRFLHANPAMIKDDAHHYALSEYSASIGDAAKILSNLVPEFEVAFDRDRESTQYCINKKAFAASWPKHMDVSDAVKDWSFIQHHTLKESLQHHFNRLVKEYKADLTQARIAQSPREFGAGIL